MPLEIDSRTGLLALLGSPVGHSLSPAIHNAALAQMGLNLVYLAFQIEPDQLGQALAGLKSLGFRGANITVPFKEKVIPYLDRLDSTAQVTGAVNTLVVEEGGQLSGYNTDVLGFERSLRETGFDPKGRTVLILGAGGAARAVLYSLITQGASVIYLANRTWEKARRLVEDWSSLTTARLIPLLLSSDDLRPALEKSDLLVNTTSVGLERDESPLPTEVLPPPSTLVYDLIYRPCPTRLLREAGNRGCPTYGGHRMLVYQAAASLKLWTVLDPPIDVMFHALTGQNVSR